ncbi:hypothetical protein [Streptomyces sp. NRRL S-495]|uniref:hypothetical protein n=1 Tax=Streptomyces sp. NRRL S-495 TaxID=1609133 RepID=UPI001331B007|nr:hypothetical protein [Streptomyces sp. NRRL S-495]
MTEMVAEPKVKGMTVVEIADAAGVSPYLVSTVTRIAKVPRLGKRSGLDPETGERVVAAIRAGLLNERTARAVAEDIDGTIAASRELIALLEEMKATQGEQAA